MSPAEYRALAEFRHQIRRFLRFSEAAAAQAGLEPQQHQVLLTIKGVGQPTVGDLAERLQLRHHSVVGLLDRLAERNLIERSRGGVDRRQVHIHLTQKGEEILRRLSIDHRAELRTAGPDLVRALAAVTGGQA